jgi:phosphoribosylanthranilate isomerase
MRVKVCGIRTRAEAVAAASAGAAYVGLVFFARSPRALTLGDARWIAEGSPEGLIRVALTVDADDEILDAIVANVPIEMIQLHGRETPDRVVAVRERYRLPVMKALGIRDEEDLEALRDYECTADQLLVDARPPSGADRPGGHGTSFDWRLIQNRRWRVPWMLAGGLTPENVAEAVRQTGAEQVDVSSGVEARPGDKDPARILAFIRAATSGACASPAAKRPG